VTLCTLFGGNAVAIKLSLYGIDVLATAAMRFGAASVVIALWARATGQTFRVPPHRRAVVVLLSLIFTVQLSLFYLGLSRTFASRATLLINLQPFVLMLLAHRFIPGDTITYRKVAGMLLGFAGVAFVFLDRPDVAAPLRSGDLLVLAACLIWAFNAILVKRVIADLRPFHVVLYPMLLAAPLMAGASLIHGRPLIRHLDAAVIGGVLYQSFVTASFGFLAWNHLLKRYGAVAMHSFLFIMPVSGVALGGLLLGEPISVRLVAALLLIAAGLLCIHYRHKALAPLQTIGRNA